MLRFLLFVLCVGIVAIAILILRCWSSDKNRPAKTLRREDRREADDAEIEDVRTVLNTYYRPNGVNDWVDEANNTTRKFNDWVRAQTSALDKEQGVLRACAMWLTKMQNVLRSTSETLEKDAKSHLSELADDDKEEEEEEEGETPNLARTFSAIHDLFRRRLEFERLSADFQKRATAYGDDSKAFRARVDACNQERQAKSVVIVALQEETKKKVEDFGDWHRSSDKGRKFFARVNSLLRQQENSDLYGEVLRIRNRLARMTKLRQAGSPNGLILIDAVLQGEEGMRHQLQTQFIVDTGATIVTVSMELVRALHLEDRLGDLMKLTLAGGIEATGPRILLPEMAVLGMTAKDVEAVVIDAPDVGIDGLLGHSFLDRFNYQIDPTTETKLVLEEKKNRLVVSDVGEQEQPSRELAD